MSGIFRDYVGPYGPFWKCRACGRKDHAHRRICPSCGEVDQAVPVVARVVGRDKPLGIPIGVLEVEEMADAE